MLRSVLMVTVGLVVAIPAWTGVFGGSGVVLQYSDQAPVGIVALRSSENAPALFLNAATVQTTWQLVMTDPAGATVQVDPLSRQLGGNVDVTAERLTIVWDATEVPGGIVKVSCVFEKPNGPLADLAALPTSARQQPILLGSITVANESACALREVQFPCLTFVATPAPAEQTTLVFPRAYGRSWRDPFHGPRGYLVGTQEPAGLTGGSEMHFGTLFDDAGHGLYWAHLDPQGYHKRTVYDNKIAGQIEFKLCVTPEQCLTPGADFNSPYPIALGAYHGDWWDAAQMYRQWALAQKWCAKGPWHKRADVPEWLKRCDVWIRGDARRYSAQFERDFVCDLQDLLGGVTIGVQLYGWYQPEPGKPNWMATLGWPMVEGYPEMIAETRARQIYHTAYVNVLQTDVTDLHCPPDLAPAYLLGADLQPVHYDRETGFVMCATTALWKQMLVQACERLVREGHCAGVYLDQLGGHCGTPCYSSKHGHPTGGGHYATDGLRDICASIREAMAQHDPQAALSGEVQPETLLDVTDHRLAHYNYWPGWVNLWAAVYGEYDMSYGRTISFQQSPDAENKPIPPINNYGPIGNTFVAGIAFGRIWPTDNPLNLLKSPENTELRAFFTELVKLRQVARNWLEFGHLQREVKFTTEIPELPIKDPKDRDSSMKAVLHSAWIDEDGALAFVFVNVSEQEQSFTWRADLARYEIAPAEVYSIRRLMPDGTRQSLGNLETGQHAILERTEAMPPHSALVLEVTVAGY